MPYGIIVFAFGEPGAIQANRQLAWTAINAARSTRAPLLVQRTGWCVEQTLPLLVSFVNDSVGSAATTLRVARTAVVWASASGLHSLYVVAAPDHRWRALRDTRNAIAEADASIRVRLLDQRDRYSPGSWYCKDSGQVRTRRRWLFLLRERALQATPFFVYKRIAN